MTFSIRQRWRFFYDNIPAFAGLALIILVVGTLPGFFTLCLPFFIAGGADLFGDLHNLSQVKTTVDVPPADPQSPVPPLLKGPT